MFWFARSCFDVLFCSPFCWYGAVQVRSLVYFLWTFPFKVMCSSPSLFIFISSVLFTLTRSPVIAASFANRSVLVCICWCLKVMWHGSSTESVSFGDLVRDHYIPALPPAVVLQSGTMRKSMGERRQPYQKSFFLFQRPLPVSHCRLPRL